MPKLRDLNLGNIAIFANYEESVPKSIINVKRLTDEKIMYANCYDDFCCHNFNGTGVQSTSKT
jgi:hypothetical protein